MGVGQGVARGPISGPGAPLVERARAQRAPRSRPLRAAGDLDRLDQRGGARSAGLGLDRRGGARSAGRARLRNGSPRWSSGRERSEHPGRDHWARRVISTGSISGAGRARLRNGSPRWSSGRERSEHPGRDHWARRVISTGSISGVGLDQRVGSDQRAGPDCETAAPAGRAGASAASTQVETTAPGG